MSVIKHKEQRVGIFIDAQNLYHSAKNLYHSRVNFGAIVKDALGGRVFHASEVSQVRFTAVSVAALVPCFFLFLLVPGKTLAMVALIPLATGLDAMRQLAFAGAAFPAGTPSPLVEIGILVIMSIGSILAARWMLLAMERRARRDGRLSVRWQ